MMKSTVVIIDDEPLAIDVIVNHIQRFPDFEIVGTFTQPEEAFEYLQRHAVDLVFTDIAMPHISGTELVRAHKNRTQFVMTTSYSEYAIECFELNVVDYLLKPVSLERINLTVQRFKDSQKNSSSLPVDGHEPSFYIKEGDEFVKVCLRDIDYIEGMKDYAKIVCGKNYYLTLKTLKSIAQKLVDFHFIRIHKSYVIPIKKVTQYNNKCVLIGPHEIPVGRSYRSVLKSYLEAHQF